ncbi:hypothetical protein MRS44_018232 [Fusarium solani]|uniref:uncharacterized protein n=1 Tax=Fusarium solani TaxID=169388 RepID=UPI0032C4488F|nr:hypothetical protein MRS44_018232 [Fusarium solani]
MASTVSPGRPNTPSANIDSIFHGSQFSILTRRGETDHLQAFVLKTENGERSMILSAAAHDAQGAIKALHDNSASAVDRDARPEGVYDTSDTEPSGSATDDSDDGMERGIARRGRQRGRGAAEQWEPAAISTPRNLPDSQSCIALQLPDVQPARPPVMAGVSPPPGPPVSHPSTGQSVYVAFLNIHWFGNGKKSMVANTVPTKQSLVRLAINETRIQPLTFADEEADYPLRSHDRPNAQTIVRRVTLGDKKFEVSALGNDLSASAQPPVPDGLAGARVIWAHSDAAV